jgi:hypothetical protein
MSWLSSRKVPHSGNVFARLYHDVKGDYTQDEIERNRAPGGGFGSNFWDKIANHAGDLGTRGAKYIPALIAGSYGINGDAAAGDGAVDPGVTDLGGFGFGGGATAGGEAGAAAGGLDPGVTDLGGFGFNSGNPGASELGTASASNAYQKYSSGNMPRGSQQQYDYEAQAEADRARQERQRRAMMQDYITNGPGSGIGVPRQAATTDHWSVFQDSPM